MFSSVNVNEGIMTVSYTHLALLEEGLKEEGLTLAEFSPELLCDDSSAAKQQAEFLQAQLKEHLGVTLNIRQVTYLSLIHI